MIGFVAPPLLKSHLVLACDLVISYEQLTKVQVYVVRTQTPARVHNEEAHRVSTYVFHEYTLVSAVTEAYYLKLQLVQK